MWIAKEGEDAEFTSVNEQSEPALLASLALRASLWLLLRFAAF
jgi:hypothetical protein